MSRSTARFNQNGRESTFVFREISYAEHRIVRTHRFLILKIALVSVGAAALLSCGRSDHNKGGAQVDQSDPAVVAITADIQMPLLFAIPLGTNNGTDNVDDGVNARTLDNNGSLMGVGDGVLVRGSYTLEEGRAGTCVPPVFQFQFAPNTQWMAARVLQRVENIAFEEKNNSNSPYINNNHYFPVPQLAKTYRYWFQNGYCHRWYLYDFGHFNVTDIQRVNEFDGPDRQTGAMTKIRSYKVTAEFLPSSTLTSVAPAANFGHFVWTVALEQNPVTTEWVIYKLGDVTLNP